MKHTYAFSYAGASNLLGSQNSTTTLVLAPGMGGGGLSLKQIGIGAGLVATLIVGAVVLGKKRQSRTATKKR